MQMFEIEKYNIFDFHTYNLIQIWYFSYLT